MENKAIEPGTNLWYQVKCKEYLEHEEQFRWFLDKYFGPNLFQSLHDLAVQDKGRLLMAYLNDIWFGLPDHLFNIRENPPGWKAFLRIIEIEGKKPVA